MYSLKLAHLIKEHTGAEVFNFYIDMRTPGKGFEEFYQKLLNEGVHFIRGRVAEVTDWALEPSEEGKLVIRVEDTLAGFVRRIPVDMVVLATGLEPRADAQDVRRMFNITCARRRLLPGAPSQAGAGEHLHRRHLPGRLLPGAQGHSRHGGAGRRRRGRGHGADRRRLRGNRTQHRLRDRGGLLRLQDLHPHVPVPRDFLHAGDPQVAHQRSAVQRLRHVRGRLSRPAPSGRTCSRTRRSSKRSKGY